MPSETAIRIFRIGDQTAIDLAAVDLARCLREMTGERVTVRTVARYEADRAGIYLGEAASFRQALGRRTGPPSRWDDELVVCSVDDSLILTGSNPRSVTFAAYRWLEQLGARWIRPGADGEVLPRVASPALTGWSIHEKAGNRHRGIVIEGSCFIEQVLDMIDWMPKLRMNSYMMQFRVSGTFWRRWYERTDCEAVENPHTMTLEECAALDLRVIDAVKERGLLLHRVGHGWTSSAVGNDASGWETYPPAPEEIRPLLAEVGGKRDWFEGIPLNTELCYSNQEARRRFVDEVLSYAAAHPEVDVLHIWASDGTNNHCECAACAKLEPSDWYVSLLNEISPRLARIAPEMRLVALCYSNTMWPPQNVAPEGLGENVTFMFAPISRCYAHSILDPECAAEPVLTPWKRNHVVNPRANTDYAAMLRAWQEYLPAGRDSFVFDYHLWVHSIEDLIVSDFAQVLRNDIRQYKSVGLGGYLSCQIQRVFVPTSLPQVALAAYLWKPTLTAHDLEEAYYAAAFGPAAAAARSFVRAFTRATGACTHGSQWDPTKSVERIPAVWRVLLRHMPRLRKAEGLCEERAHKLSMRLLVYYVGYQQLLWRALAARQQGRPHARELLDQAADFLRRTEPRVYQWMDSPYWYDGFHRQIERAWDREDAGSA